jgi:hypothetical protein
MMKDDRDDASKEKLRDASLREVHKVWSLTEADIIKSVLESEGIPCFFQGNISHSIYPFDVNGLGEVKIFVNESDYEAAKEILENREPEPEKD